MLQLLQKQKLKPIIWMLFLNLVFIKWEDNDDGGLINDEIAFPDAKDNIDAG